MLALSELIKIFLLFYSDLSSLFCATKCLFDFVQFKQFIYFVKHRNSEWYLFIWIWYLRNKKWNYNNWSNVLKSILKIKAILNTLMCEMKVATFARCGSWIPCALYFTNNYYESSLKNSIIVETFTIIAGFNRILLDQPVNVYEGIQNKWPNNKTNNIKFGTIACDPM